MRYEFRKARADDFPILLKNSTENGKVNQEIIDTSDEIRVMACDGVPILAIGCVTYNTGTDENMIGVWAIVSKDIKKHAKRAVIFLEDLMFSRVATKFVVLIDESKPVFIKFVQHFGFKRTKVVEECDGTLYHVYVKEN